ncbi:chromate transporter [Kitasatospora mediocidica]|uniref:chromate transporter n=1 Tax=Kitasatospora mediocidica TaxID=58352 RepID=UPI00056D73E2|nr:chromate transporter [Kitasatospora mediocidica]
MISLLTRLAGVFSQLSVLSFGGGNAILPELQRQVVGVNSWATPDQFHTLFGLSQAAPGPNLMIVTLVGWHVAGLLGALVATLAMIGPSALLAVVATRLWHGLRERPWQQRVQAALTPVSAGLVAAGALFAVRTSAATTTGTVIVVAATALALTRRFHPLALLGTGAACGLLVTVI